MTTQNVACPITIVESERSRWLNVKNEFSAMPVMMPGSAIGRRSRNETASRPKNRKRAIAKAAAEPSTRAAPGGGRGRTHREPQRLGHLLVVPRDAEPLRREARDRPALHIRRVERVDDDQRER